MDVLPVPVRLTAKLASNLACCLIALLIPLMFVTKCRQDDRLCIGPPVPFDPDLWMRGPRGYVSIDEATRVHQCMADDLVQSKRLVGLARQQVFELLGEPDHEPWSPTYPVAGWSLGQRRGLYGETFPLLVEFDATGRAVRAWTP